MSVTYIVARLVKRDKKIRFLTLANVALLLECGSIPRHIGLQSIQI